MSYQVQRLEPAGAITLAFASIDRDQVELWLYKQKRRAYHRRGRVWIQERDKPATRRGRGRIRRGLIT